MGWSEGGGDITIKESGVSIGSRRALNLIEGANITITPVDDPTNQEVDVTIEAAAGAAGDFQLIETKVVGADAQDVTFSSLDGDADGEYLLVWFIKKAGAASTTTYTLEPNSLATNQKTITQNADGTSNATSTTTTIRIAVLGATADTSAGGHTFINATTVTAPGGARFFQTLEMSQDGAQSGRHVGWWTDVSTNLTSLNIHASLAAGIADNSTFSLYKLLKA